MRVSQVEDFFAYECAVRFKEEVHRLVLASPEAYRDFKYRCQLWEAADGIESHISEGFYRGNPSEFSNFLRYALGSLAEAVRRVRSGISREYLREPDCKVALMWAERCSGATRGLKASQDREAARRRSARRRPRNTGRSRRSGFVHSP